MLLYYITDRRQFPGGEAEQRRRLLSKISEAAAADIEYIQVREKDLSARQLEELGRAAVRAVRENSRATKLLLNSRLDVAIATGADGVHLTSIDIISAGDARAVASSSGISAFLVGQSTHNLADLELAYSHGADIAVFGPVFGKIASPARQGMGVEELRRAFTRFRREGFASGERAFDVFALGGVTLENARACVHAGAAGVAAIRLFQEGNIQQTARALRGE